MFDMSKRYFHLVYKSFYKPEDILNEDRPSALEDLNQNLIEVTQAEFDEFCGSRSPRGYTFGINNEKRPAWIPLEITLLIDEKKKEINKACENAIVAGFNSSALGESHMYKSDRDDQLNLMGAAATGLDQPFKCRDSEGVWQYKLHTAEQIAIVFSDGAMLKGQYLIKAQNLREQADVCTNIDEINQIQW